MMKSMLLGAALAALATIAHADVFRTSCEYTADGRSGTYEVLVDNRNGLSFFITYDQRPKVPSDISRTRITPLGIISGERDGTFRIFTLVNPKNATRFVVKFVDHDYVHSDGQDYPTEEIASFSPQGGMAYDKCGVGE